MKTRAHYTSPMKYSPRLSAPLSRSPIARWSTPWKESRADRVKRSIRWILRVSVAVSSESSVGGLKSAEYQHAIVISLDRLPTAKGSKGEQRKAKGTEGRVRRQRGTVIVLDLRVESKRYTKGKRYDYKNVRSVGAHSSPDESAVSSIFPLPYASCNIVRN